MRKVAILMEHNFKPGDRVRILPDHSPHFGGLIATIIYGDGQIAEPYVYAQADGYSGDLLGLGRGVGAFHENMLEPYVEPDAIGAVVYVTGDEADYGHGFEVGTPVRIVGDDYLEDGTYDCDPIDGGLAMYVAASDLSVDEPLAEPKFKVGDKVKVVRSNYSGRTRQPGATGVVLTHTSTDRVVVRIDAEGPSSRWSFREDCLELWAPEESVKPDFKVGDFVRITDAEYLASGEFLGEITAINHDNPPRSYCGRPHPFTVEATHRDGEPTAIGTLFAVSVEKIDRPKPEIKVGDFVKVTDDAYDAAAGRNVMGTVLRTDADSLWPGDERVHPFHIAVTHIDGGTPMWETIWHAVSVEHADRPAPTAEEARAAFDAFSRELDGEDKPTAEEIATARKVLLAALDALES